MNADFCSRDKPIPETRSEQLLGYQKWIFSDPAEVATLACSGDGGGFVETLGVENSQNFSHIRTRFSSFMVSKTGDEGWLLVECCLQRERHVIPRNALHVDPR